MFLRVRDRNTADESYDVYDDYQAMVEDLDRAEPVFEYYYIRSTPGSIALQPVTLGNRSTVLTFQEVELVAGGATVGSGRITGGN